MFSSSKGFRRRGLPLAAVAMLLLGQQCPELRPPDEDGTTVEPGLAVFVSDDGFMTNTVYDLDEEGVTFNPTEGTLIWTDGTAYPGWQIAGNALTFDGRSFEVHFGSRDDQARAYLTEGDPPRVVNLRVEGGALVVNPTVFLVPESGRSGSAIGAGIYTLAGTGGMQGMFVFDTTKSQFICAATLGGETLAAPGNFTMIITGSTIVDRVRYSTVRVNGVFRNRAQFTLTGLSVTVNNGVPGLPGDQGGGDAEVLFDELVDCTVVVDVVDDDQGGDRYRATIYNAEIWPDGTQFKNFEGDQIATGTVLPLISGGLTVSPPQ